MVRAKVVTVICA